MQTSAVVSVNFVLPLAREAVRVLNVKNESLSGSDNVTLQELDRARAIMYMALESVNNTMIVDLDTMIFLQKSRT